MLVKKSGCIVQSKNNPNLIMMIYRKAQDDFSFPKGHVEENEDFLSCAIREVKEETGLDIRIFRDFGTMNYKDSLGQEVVCKYYIAASLDDKKAIAENGCCIEWINKEDVINKISYDNLRDFYVKNFATLIKKDNLL